MDNYSTVMIEFDRRAERIGEKFRKMQHLEYFGRAQTGLAQSFYRRKMKRLRRELRDRMDTMEVLA